MPLTLRLPPALPDDVVFANPVESIVATATIEPVGQLFERRAALLAGALRGWCEEGGASAAAASSGRGAGAAGSPSRDDGARRGGDASTRRIVKLSDDDLTVDWYALLKLPDGEGASEDAIRSAYRRRCLETHPDKQPNRSDELFKRVQRAFEILGDADARRAYDSSRPFDDTIPGEDVDDARFFSTFGPVFDRNKKWSSGGRPPSLGDENTPIHDVNRFYDAWFAFRTWRDFSHEVELVETDDGMCREEKRYYQRENERQLAALRRNETKRIRTLVERAMKLDPRLRKRREEEEAARLREKAERDAERQRLRDEEARRRNELAEKERQAEEERHRRIVEAKAMVRAKQQELTAFLEAAGLLDRTPTNKLLPDVVRVPNITWVFSKIGTPDDADAFVAAITGLATTGGDGGGVPAVLKFNELLEARERQVGMNRFGEAVKKDVPAAAAAAKPGAATGATASPAVLWTTEDVSLLHKAIARYPGGTVDRWRKISVMLREKFSEEAVLAKTKELDAAFRAASTGAASAAAAAPAGDATAAAAAAPAVNAAAAPSASMAAATAAAASLEEWTQKQQKQLEAGLRDLKDYKEKDKFQKIAAGVEGKTAKQCFERFKYLCSLNKK